MGLAIKLEVSSDPLSLSVVRSAVQQLSVVAGFPDRECRLITLAVDEAMTNIIRHAYQNRRDQTIAVHCRQNQEGLEFVLVDRGRAADPATLHGRSLGEVQPGGLGLHFIGQIMDEVVYQPLEDRNELRLVKYLAGKPPQGE